MDLAEKMARNRGVSPGYHLMRHALAVAVLVAHGFFIVKGVPSVVAVPEAGPGFAKAGIYVGSGGVFRYLQPAVMSLVASFFVLSGFLVTGSALRTRRVDRFLFNRAIRIFPALVSEVLLSALLLGPLTTVVAWDVYFQDARFLRYLGNMFGFVAFELPGVFLTNPWPAVVNANLWTLPPEFYCYLILAVAMLTGILSRRRLLLVAVVFFVAVLCLEESTRTFGWQARADVNRFSGWFVVYEFVLGATFRILADRVPYHAGLFAVSATGYVIGIMTAAMDPVTGVCLAYCTVYLGEVRFPAFDRLVQSDLSYGIYLYGFPISQALTFLLKGRIDHLGLAEQLALMLPLCLCVTIAFARLSWILIEKPALRFKSISRPSAVEKDADSAGKDRSSRSVEVRAGAKSAFSRSGRRFGERKHVITKA